MAAADLLRHQLEEGEPVGHGERLGIGEIDLELAVAVLVIEGIHAPAQAIHALHQLIEPVEIVEQAAQVVAGFIERVAAAGRHQRSIVLAPQHEEFSFDAEVEAIAQRRRLLPHPREDLTAAGLEGGAVQLQAAGQPHHIAAPRQHRGTGQIGNGRHFVIADVLRHPIERRAGEQLRTRQHRREVIQRHCLRLAVAVDVHEAGQRILHAAAEQIQLQLLAKIGARQLRRRQRL